MVIVVILLEREKIFLYACSQIKSDSEYMLDAEVYYDYLKKYKPISIIKKMDYDSPLDIDKYVKQYMIEYGVEFVRGGTYSEEILSDILTHALLCELETISSYLKHENILNEMIQTYAYQPMTNDQIADEKNRLNNTLEQFQKERQEYESFIINGCQIIQDIQWIRYMCSQQLKMYRENTRQAYVCKLIQKECNEKYKTILLSLKRVYTIFTSLNICNETLSDDKGQQLSINAYIRYPQFLLDDFFFHWHRVQIEDSIKQVDVLCNTYEYMTNCIINKMDEKKFDVSSWGEAIEWKIPRALYLLDKFDSNSY